MVCSGLNRQMHHKCIILGKILGFCPPWLLSAWILSSMGFCPHWILSPWVFVLLGFCLTWILSPWAFVPIGFCPPGFLSSLDFVRLDIVLWVFVQWDFVLEPPGHDVHLYCDIHPVRVVVLPLLKQSPAWHHSSFVVRPSFRVPPALISVSLRLSCPSSSSPR